LKQKHEEGQRLLHYLQQTNTASATGIFLNVINQVIYGLKLNVYNPEFPLKIPDVCRDVRIARISKYATVLRTVCNYGYF
jgi:hypothetical protein